MTEADDGVDVGLNAGDQIDAGPPRESPRSDGRSDSRSDGEAVTAAQAQSPRSRLGVSLAIAAAVVVLDQLTKRWALRALADGRPRHVVWTLQWNLTFNSGMAFSRGQGIGPYIGAIALIVIVILLLSLRRSTGWLSTIAVGLVVGGAIGNLIDRLTREDGWLRGRVVDFIDFQWFPIFNVADMGITIGGLLLLLSAALESRASIT